MSAAASPVLILMATWNGAAHLPAQLASIAAQRGAEWRLVVSDDGSRDGTRAIVEAFARDQGADRVRLVTGPGRGAAANFLSLLTRPDLPLEPGACLAFADQDDVWLPHRLAHGLDRIGGVDGPALHSARWREIDADGRLLAAAPPPSRPVGLRNLAVENRFSGHTMLLNPAAIARARSVPVPDGLGFHDWWLALLICATGGRCDLSDEIVLHYRQHGANVQGGDGGLRGAARRLGQIGQGRYRRWIDANLTGLRGAGPLLTPEAATLVQALTGPRAPRPGPARARAMARLGLYRQRRAETALLLGSAALGLA